MFFALATITLGYLATLLAPRWDDLRVMHSWNTVPENWEILGPPPSGTTINLYVMLRPYRENVLIAALHEVSSPGNPKHVLPPLVHPCTYSRVLLGFRYGVHLSKEQVAELVRSHPDTLELVDS